MVTGVQTCALPIFGLREGADVIGAVLVTSSLMIGTYAIVKPAAEQGWGATETLLFGAGSLALLALFVLREATAKTPLIPLSIFKARNLTGANVVQILAVPGMFGMFFLGSLYLERVLSYSPLEIGLAVEAFSKIGRASCRERVSYHV